MVFECLKRWRDYGNLSRRDPRTTCRILLDFRVLEDVRFLKQLNSQNSIACYFNLVPVDEISLFR